MCEKRRSLLENGHGPAYNSLLDHLHEMDKDVAEGDDDPRGTKIWKLLSKGSIENTECFGQPGHVDEFARAFRKHRELWQYAVEDHYLRECFARIPEMVRRASRLIPITINRIPNEEVRHLLAEATRCFIYGFFQASAALSRAALESALNEQLRDRLAYVPDAKLSVKIEKAVNFKLISAKASSLASDVRLTANRVLHAKTVSGARAFLAELYGR